MVFEKVTSGRGDTPQPKQPMKRRGGGRGPSHSAAHDTEPQALPTHLVQPGPQCPWRRQSPCRCCRGCRCQCLHCQTGVGHGASQPPPLRLQPAALHTPSVPVSHNQCHTPSAPVSHNQGYNQRHNHRRNQRHSQRHNQGALAHQHTSATCAKASLLPASTPLPHPRKAFLVILGDTTSVLHHTQAMSPDCRGT